MIGTGKVNEQIPFLLDRDRLLSHGLISCISRDDRRAFHASRSLVDLAQGGERFMS